MDDLDKLLEHTRKSGWTVGRSKKHYRLIGPEGQVVIAPLTPSDRRAVLNMRSHLYRAGLPRITPLKRDVPPSSLQAPHGSLGR